MPGIVIIPGTFNPVATPLQKIGIMTFPRAPDVTLTKPWAQMQWSTRSTEIPAPPGIDVVYTFCDYVTGDIEVGVDVPVFNSGIANFETTAVRYVPDAIYAKTGFDSSGQIYRAVAPIPPFAPPAKYNIGYIEIEQGASTLGYNSILVPLPYAMTIDGDTDGATYLTVPAASTGTLDLRIGGIGGGGPGGFGENEIDVDTTLDFTIALRRDGVVIDRIYAALAVIGTVKVKALDVSVAQTPQPTITTGYTYTDTLYGPGIDTSTVIIPPPPFPYGGYVRTSTVRQGKAVLS